MYTTPGKSDENTKTIQKLVRLVEDVLLYVKNGEKPKQKFPSLSDALRLQQHLNKVEDMTKSIGPVQYVTGAKREFLISSNDLERLG